MNVETKCPSKPSYFLKDHQRYSLFLLSSVLMFLEILVDCRYKNINGVSFTGYATYHQKNPEETFRKLAVFGRKCF